MYLSEKILQWHMADINQQTVSGRPLPVDDAPAARWGDLSCSENLRLSEELPQEHRTLWREWPTVLMSRLNLRLVLLRTLRLPLVSQGAR